MFLDIYVWSDGPLSLEGRHVMEPRAPSHVIKLTSQQFGGLGNNTELVEENVRGLIWRMNTQSTSLRHATGGSVIALPRSVASDELGTSLQLRSREYCNSPLTDIDDSDEGLCCLS